MVYSLIRFMTTEQIEAEVNRIARNAKEFLQMPPVVNVVEDKHQIISNDPALKDFSDTCFIFTDITYGVKSKDRKIVIRHVDGTLENAPQSIRKRINQMYFPQEGRSFHNPKLFEDQYFTQCLTDKKYQFILDRICLQYEPYEKEFHEFTSRVFITINDTKNFDDLRSTRHFGPLAFFLSWHKLIDNLLIDMIQRDYLSNGVELITLMYDLNGIEYDKTILDSLPRHDDLESQYKPFAENATNVIEGSVGKTSEEFDLGDKCLEFIETYAKTNSPKRPQIELVLQTYREINNEKRKLLEGLKKAHGISGSSQ